MNEDASKKKMEEATIEEIGDRRWYHINRNFLPIKLVYFWNFCASYTILPLLTLQMTSLGLTLADVAQVYLFMPIASLVAPIVIGLLADRTGRIRELYIGCLVVHCLLHHMLFYIPASPHTTPEALAASSNGSRLECADWPPPPCGNLTRTLHCTLVCDAADTTGGAGLLLCPADGPCREATPTAVLQLPLGSDGCQLPASLVDGDVQLQLHHGEFSCPSSCWLDCAPASGLPVSNRTTFWIYFWLRLAATFFLKPTFTLLDATNLALVKRHKEPGQNFGRQRVTAILATVIMPPLAGLLIDVFSGDGLTMTVAGLASMPFNWWSDAITRKIGHVNVLIMAFFGYAVRYVGYSLIKVPWLCFPFELLEVVTVHLMWNSAATYTAQLAPPGLLATMTGLSGMLHYNAGHGLGSFVGGYLMASYGMEFTYRVIGVASGVAGILYAVVYYCCLHGHIKRREKAVGAAVEETLPTGTSTATLTTIVQSEDGARLESTKL
ncbi:Major facilitator superfamily domain-containing protein 6-B [Amphibalanus amphitrite]|uniref:Major facilitator superfamily domain-containing protein 6-B n=1 Tax=Amphibalanus amphitrite TaxID=1232801 RepID=A0A6A4VTU8_AMPAM|nr:Major facilitator superfamily domain-containing protein 6-B [Amphibalanus amphitrite]